MVPKSDSFKGMARSTNDVGRRAGREPHVVESKLPLDTVSPMLLELIGARYPLATDLTTAVIKICPHTLHP